MPKVEVDVQVDNKQQINDLNNQVVQLQQSLERLKSTAKGRPMDPMSEDMDKTSRSIEAVNRQLDQANQKFEEVKEQHSSLAKLGGYAWGALSAYSTLSDAPGLYRGIKRGVNYFRNEGIPGIGQMFGGAAEEVAPVAATRFPGMALGAGIGAGAGIVAGGLWATNRIADAVQQDMVLAKMIGTTVDDLNNLRAAQAGVLAKGQAGLQSLYYQTDTSNAAWLATARRRGVPIGEGADTFDTLAELSKQIRQDPNYASRLRTVQKLYPEGDPQEIMAALEANFGRMAKRMDEVNRTIDDSAIANLTRFKDTLHDIANIPKQIVFETELYEQKIKAGIINMFGDADSTSLSSQMVQYQRPESAGFYGMLAARNKGVAAMDATRTAAESMDRAKGMFAALGISETEGIQYGGGQTLRLETGSVEKAVKWANEYLDTWTKKGPGVSLQLKKHMEQLQALDAELAYAAEHGLTLGTGSALQQVPRDRLQKQIWEETNILTTAMAEKGLAEQLNTARRQPTALEYDLGDQIQEQMIANRLGALARPQSPGLRLEQFWLQQREAGAQLNEMFRDDPLGGLSPFMKQYRYSQMGRRGQVAAMRDRRATIYNADTWDTSGRDRLDEYIRSMESDINRQDRQLLLQQRSGFEGAMIQMSAFPGQERATAQATLEHNVQVAKEFFALTKGNEDDQLKRRLSLIAATQQYAATIKQLDMREQWEQRQMPGQIAAMEHGFNLQMIGVSAMPGQERGTIQRTYEEQIAYAMAQVPINESLGMTRGRAVQQYLLAKRGYDIQRQLSVAGYERNLADQARQIDISEISSTAQYDIQHLQLWARPGQERMIQGMVSGIERRSLEEQIRRAGGSYTDRQIESMWTGQGMRERAAADQLDRRDYARQQEQNLDRVRNELQLTSQIVALRNDGEYITTKKTHELRLEALKKELEITGDIYEYGKQTRDENLSYQMQLNQLAAQRKATVEGHAGALFDDIWSTSIGRAGGPNRPLAGIGTYLGQMGTQTARTIFTQTAGELWKTISGVTGTAGGAIPGQLDENKQLTMLGRILKGTFLGVDQSKLVQNAATASNTRSTDANTQATDALTRAMQMMASKGCNCGGGGGGYGYSPASWGRSTVAMGYDFGYSRMGGGGSIPSVSSTISFGDDAYSGADYAYSGDDGAYYSPMGGYSPAVGASPMGYDGGYSPAPSMGYDGGYSPVSAGMSAAANAAKGTRASSIAKGVGKAAGVAAAGYGVYAGIKKGGAVGGLQAASAALGGAAIFGGPAAPFLAAASIIAGTVSMFLPDTYANRMRSEEDWIRNAQLKMPDPVRLTINANGQSVDYDFRGQIRSFGGTSPLGTSPGLPATPTESAPITVDLGDGRDRLSAAGRGRVSIVQNFSLLDTASLMQRRSEIAEVTRAALDDFHPLRQTIRQLR